MIASKSIKKALNAIHAITLYNEPEKTKSAAIIANFLEKKYFTNPGVSHYHKALNVSNELPEETQLTQLKNHLKKAIPYLPAIKLLAQVMNKIEKKHQDAFQLLEDHLQDNPYKALDLLTEMNIVVSEFSDTSKKLEYLEKLKLIHKQIYNDETLEPITQIDSIFFAYQHKKKDPKVLLQQLTQIDIFYEIKLIMDTEIPLLIECKKQLSKQRFKQTLKELQTLSNLQQENIFKEYKVNNPLIKKFFELNIKNISTVFNNWCNSMIHLAEDIFKDDPTKLGIVYLRFLAIKPLSSLPKNVITEEFLDILNTLLTPLQKRIEDKYSKLNLTTDKKELILLGPNETMVPYDLTDLCYHQFETSYTCFTQSPHNQQPSTYILTAKDYFITGLYISNTSTDYYKSLRYLIESYFLFKQNNISAPYILFKAILETAINSELTQDLNDIIPPILLNDMQKRCFDENYFFDYLQLTSRTPKQNPSKTPDLKTLITKNLFEGIYNFQNCAAFYFLSNPSDTYHTECKESLIQINDSKKQEILDLIFSSQPPKNHQLDLATKLLLTINQKDLAHMYSKYKKFIPPLEKLKIENHIHNNTHATLHKTIEYLKNCQTDKINFSQINKIEQTKLLKSIQLITNLDWVLYPEILPLITDKQSELFSIMEQLKSYSPLINAIYNNALITSEQICNDAIQKKVPIIYPIKIQQHQQTLSQITKWQQDLESIDTNKVKKETLRQLKIIQDNLIKITKQLYHTSPFLNSQSLSNITHPLPKELKTTKAQIVKTRQKLQQRINILIKKGSLLGNPECQYLHAIQQESLEQRKFLLEKAYKNGHLKSTIQLAKLQLQSNPQDAFSILTNTMLDSFNDKKLDYTTNYNMFQRYSMAAQLIIENDQSSNSNIKFFFRDQDKKVYILKSIQTALYWLILNQKNNQEHALKLKKSIIETCNTLVKYTDIRPYKTTDDKLFFANFIPAANRIKDSLNQEAKQHLELLESHNTKKKSHPKKTNSAHKKKGKGSKK